MSDNEWEKSAVLFCVLYTSTSRANLSFHFTTGIKLFICNYYCDLSNRLCFFQYKTHLCGIKTAKSHWKRWKLYWLNLKFDEEIITVLVKLVYGRRELDRKKTHLPWLCNFFRIMRLNVTLVSYAFVLSIFFA